MKMNIITSEERMIYRLYPNSFTAARVRLRLAVLHFERELSKTFLFRKILNL